jgi:hypothetical protein
MMYLPTLYTLDSPEITCETPDRVLNEKPNLILPGSADAFPIFRKLPDCLAPWRIAARKMHEWYVQYFPLDIHRFDATQGNGTLGWTSREVQGRN